MEEQGVDTSSRIHLGFFWFVSALCLGSSSEDSPANTFFSPALAFGWLLRHHLVGPRLPSALASEGKESLLRLHQWGRGCFWSLCCAEAGDGPCPSIQRSQSGGTRVFIFFGGGVISRLALFFFYDV